MVCLDLGCGEGHNTRLLAGKGAQAAAVMNDSAISRAAMRAPFPASRRVLCPSPQPRSRYTSPSTGGSSSKNAGVFTKSR